MAATQHDKQLELCGKVIGGMFGAALSLAVLSSFAGLFTNLGDTHKLLSTAATVFLYMGIISCAALAIRLLHVNGVVERSLHQVAALLAQRHRPSH